MKILMSRSACEYSVQAFQHHGSCLRWPVNREGVPAKRKTPPPPSPLAFRGRVQGAAAAGLGRIGETTQRRAGDSGKGCKEKKPATRYPRGGVLRFMGSTLVIIRTIPIGA
jgi:hypothetical protein